jgi:hypothetical protein
LQQALYLIALPLLYLLHQQFFFFKTVLYITTPTDVYIEVLTEVMESIITEMHKKKVVKLLHSQGEKKSLSCCQVNNPSSRASQFHTDKDLIYGSQEP